MKRRNIIVLLGASGAGKDTFYRVLSSKIPGWRRLSFGDSLRGITHRTTGKTCPYPFGSVSRDTWERESGFKALMVAEARVQICRDPFSLIEEVEATLVTTPGNYVVTDCRSELELDVLVCHGNVWVIRIERESNPHPVGFLDNDLTVEPHGVFHNDKDGMCVEDVVVFTSSILRKKPLCFLRENERWTQRNT